MQYDYTLFAFMYVNSVCSPLGRILSTLLLRLCQTIGPIWRSACAIDSATVSSLFDSLSPIVLALFIPFFFVSETFLSSLSSTDDCKFAERGHKKCVLLFFGFGAATVVPEKSILLVSAVSTCGTRF